MFCQKDVAKISQNSQENNCAQVFSCEFCEIFKNIFFHRTPPATASVEILMWFEVYSWSGSKNYQLILLNNLKSSLNKNTKTEKLMNY